MLAHLAAVPSRYLRLWALNLAAALLQLDIVAFANMTPGGPPGPGATPRQGPAAAERQDSAAVHKGAGEDPHSAGSWEGPPQAERAGSEGGDPGDLGGLQEGVLRRQGLAMAVLDCLVATMQREARAEATAPVDSAPHDQQDRASGGNRAAPGRGACQGGQQVREQAFAPGAALPGSPEGRGAGWGGVVGGTLAGDWEAAAAAVQSAALGDWADDARWRLELLAQMAPSVQQRRPGRTCAWGSASPFWGILRVLRAWSCWRRWRPACSSAGGAAPALGGPGPLLCLIFAGCNTCTHNLHAQTPLQLGT